MKMSGAMKLAALGVLALIVMSVMSAFAAGLNLPASNVDRQSIPVTAEDLKPAACAGVFLTNIVSGSGTLTGSAANDLIIASAGTDTIDGLGGDDCIIAGNGDDFIAGSDGIDICLSGTGNDTFDTCESEIQ